MVKKSINWILLASPGRGVNRSEVGQKSTELEILVPIRPQLFECTLPWIQTHRNTGKRTVTKTSVVVLEWSGHNALIYGQCSIGSSTDNGIMDYIEFASELSTTSSSSERTGEELRETVRNTTQFVSSVCNYCLRKHSLRLLRLLLLSAFSAAVVCLWDHTGTNDW